ncbi:CYFA0S08e03224g1_1 [Cyberlindnera fabianii]|uniref:CYFA0S08e03224g1_1 n=1 Tax=Cyberlindnera fabianii TaxID=36022 RepID=A0A061AWQ3_CYBFA|nr:hypothetical protein BON22_4156 [Cyberlindnera fabianii]CDR42066.1 CYFA0S08e03224g1_1 [Cyberlindnera fabianii]
MFYAPLTALAFAGYAAASPVAVPVAVPVADTKHGSSYANSMGPVTFLYPEVRQWSADADNTAPCGSYAAIGNRSDFPLDDGFVAFIAKYISYKVKLSISYNENPTSQSDFDEWYNGNVTSELHIGHTCFHMPDQPNSINAGDVATIQAIYINDDEDAVGTDGQPIESEFNETFYVCSDIKFVEESVFDLTDFALSCFNATNDNYYEISSIDTEASVTYDSEQASEVSAARASAGITSSSSSTSSATATSSSSASSSAASSSSSGIAAAMGAPSVGIFGAFALAIPALI